LSSSDKPGRVDEGSSLSMKIFELNHSCRVCLLLASERQLVTTRNSLDDDVLLYKRVNDGSVPSSVDDEDSMFRAIVGLGWWRKSLDSRVGHDDDGAV
jgi:hypothetical protein